VPLPPAELCFRDFGQRAESPRGDTSRRRKTTAVASAAFRRGRRGSLGDHVLFWVLFWIRTRNSRPGALFRAQGCESGASGSAWSVSTRRSQAASRSPERGGPPPSAVRRPPSAVRRPGRAGPGAARRGPARPGIALSAARRRPAPPHAGRASGPVMGLRRLQPAPAGSRAPSRLPGPSAVPSSAHDPGPLNRIVPRLSVVAIEGQAGPLIRRPPVQLGLGPYQR
jgi:hypothetical protein